RTVRRRIDVHAPDRRRQSRAGVPGRAFAGTRLPPVRHPDGHAHHRPVRSSRDSTPRVSAALARRRERRGNLHRCIGTREARRAMRGLLAISSLAWAVSAGPEEAAKKDRDAMQGTWTLTALEINGKLEAEDRLKDTVLIIKGDRYITRVKSKDI